MRKIFVVLVAVAMTSCSVLQFGDGDEPVAAGKGSPIVVTDSWATVAPTGVKQAAGFLTISNASGTDDRLLSATSPRAARMEVHEMGMEGSMTTMRELKSGIAVPAGATVSLKPTGDHLMFVDLSAPLGVGETVPVTLTFEKAGAVQVELPVRTMAAMQ